MQSLHCLSLCVITLWHVSYVDTYGRGAPRGACATMQPGHGRAGSDASPFSIDLGSVEYYKPKEKITATIKGGKFKGLFVQVRKSDNTDDGVYPPVGSFEFNPFTRGVNCDTDDDGLTHSNASLKSDLVVKWVAPDDDELGDVFFIATVAQTKMTWWRTIKSKVLKPISSKPATTTTTTPKTSTTTTTTTTTQSTSTAVQTTATEKGDTTSSIASQSEANTETNREITTTSEGKVGVSKSTTPVITSGATASLHIGMQTYFLTIIVLISTIFHSHR